MIRSSYRKWMYDWETRLTTRDTNRVVRPLEWGEDWAQGWPLSETDTAGGGFSYSVTLDDLGPSGTAPATSVYSSGPKTVTLTGVTNPFTGGLGYAGVRQVVGGNPNIDNFTVTPVPEPAGLGLIAASALGLLRRRRGIA